jgi:hypothetical protein
VDYYEGNIISWVGIMNSSTIIAIITALAALIGAASPIIVTWLQSHREQQSSNNAILLPSNVVLHHPRKRTWWLTISSYALFGGIIGYSAATILNVKYFDKASLPTLITPGVSDTPFADTTSLARTESPVLSPTNTAFQFPADTPIPSMPQTTLSPLVITMPKDGDRVLQAIDVFGSVAPSALDQGNYLNIIVFANRSSTFSVQAIPEIQPDGTWRSSPVYIGTLGSADIGKTFRICAVLHSEQLHSGDRPFFPAGEKSCISVTRE